MNRVLFSSIKQSYATPKELYKALDNEFHFTDDPCPFDDRQHALYPNDGLARAWGDVVFLNPPYGKELTKWMARAYQEARTGKTIVCLVASRTDTKWWHDYAMKADEIRFCRGRLHFENSPYNAPFPSALIIFKGK